MPQTGDGVSQQEGCQQVSERGIGGRREEGGSRKREGLVEGERRKREKWRIDWERERRRNDGVNNNHNDDNHNNIEHTQSTVQYQNK